jgi:hypothetical protein
VLLDTNLDCTESALHILTATAAFNIAVFTPAMLDEHYSNSFVDIIATLCIVCQKRDLMHTVLDAISAENVVSFSQAQFYTSATAIRTVCEIGREIATAFPVPVFIVTVQ